MTATMHNPKTKVSITGIDIKFVPKWKKLGFEIKQYDSDKVVLFKAG